MNGPFFSIGDPGRAARELPDGVPDTRSRPADAELSAAALPGMLIRAASVRGLLHRSRGTPRQDTFALTRCQVPGGPDRAVAVVCDGVGQFGRSDEAAALVSRCLADLGAVGAPWSMAFAQANEELQKAAAEALAGEPAQLPADGMATTAVAVVVHREDQDWVGTVAWVGDSTLWHLNPVHGWELLAGPTGEEADYHSSGVVALPSGSGACSSGEFRISGGALFVMSDGVANPLRWSEGVQQALADWWLRPPDPICFAGQVSFARKSHMDDRTVVGIWPDGSNTG